MTALAISSTVVAQSTDKLLDKLVQKGILSNQEADELRAEDQTNAVANSKFTVAKTIKSIEFFGDLRLRYEYRDGEFGPGTKYAGSTLALNRERYALRMGVRGDLVDNFYYGLRVESSPNPRSPWNTFGNSTTAPYQGPFSKNSYSLYIGQAYLGWHPYSWLDLSVGRVPQPFYTTPMVWDSDYCPEGLVEKVKYSVGNADLFATFGQFVYQDVNPTTGAQAITPPGGDTNPFMMTWQLGADYHITTNVSAKLAPVIYNYVGHGNTSDGFAGPFVGQGTSLGLNYSTAATSSSTLPGSGGNGYNQTGINDLFIIDFPGEVNFKIGKYSARVFGDFAWNVEGNTRARAAFNAAPGAFPSGAQLGQSKAYQAGAAVGNNLGLVYGQKAQKGTWEARVYWQHVEQYALDPNLLDSDFFEGRGNLQGLYAAVAYSFTDCIIGTARYGYAERINNNLGTGGFNADIPWLNPVNKYNLVQLDLTWKF